SPLPRGPWRARCAISFVPPEARLQTGVWNGGFGVPDTCRVLQQDAANRSELAQDPRTSCLTVATSVLACGLWSKPTSEDACGYGEQDFVGPRTRKRETPRRCGRSWLF